MTDKERIHHQIGLLLAVAIFFLIAPKNVGTTDITLNHEPVVVLDSFALAEDNSLVTLDSPLTFDVAERLDIVVTAYSSSIWETWGCPYTTASNTRVRDGIVANNMLSFGTQVRFPKLFGDKIFVVEDRMHSRKSDHHFDIWFPSRPEALEFGIKRTVVEILLEK